MIILDIQNPRNTFDCPFLEEGNNSELCCYFDPHTDARCVGLYNKGCHIMKPEPEAEACDNCVYYDECNKYDYNVDAREVHDCFEERYKNTEGQEE